MPGAVSVKEDIMTPVAQKGSRTDAHRHGLLLVEDDADTREATMLLLEHHGYDGVAVCNGREALDLLRQGLRPCVILLDLAMPVMNGFEFRRAQMNDAELAAVPVFVVSSDAYAKEAEARRAGMETFFQKPLDIDEPFIAAIRRHCQRMT